MAIILYKYLCLCFNKLVFYWTFCQLLLQFESTKEEKPNCTKTISMFHVYLFTNTSGGNSQKSFASEVTFKFL